MTAKLWGKPVYFTKSGARTLREARIEGLAVPRIELSEDCLDELAELQAVAKRMADEGKVLPELVKSVGLTVVLVLLQGCAGLGDFLAAWPTPCETRTDAQGRVEGYTYCQEVRNGE